MARYSASIIGGQNLIFRPYIEVRPDTVKFKIPGFFSGDEQTVVISSITDIRISGTLISKTIEIYTSGLGVIRAEGFSRSDAKAIEREINHNKNQPAVPTVKQKRSKMRERDDWDEQEVSNEPMGFLINTKNDFTDLDALPLISFSHQPKPLVETLNTLVHYATIESKTTASSDSKKMFVAYLEKLREGERILDSLDFSDNSYYLNERAIIKASIQKLDSNLNRKLKTKKTMPIFYTLLWIAAAFFCFRACSGCYDSVKEWADSPTEYSTPKKHNRK